MHAPLAPGRLRRRRNRFLIPDINAYESVVPKAHPESRYALNLHRFNFNAFSLWYNRAWKGRHSTVQNDTSRLITIPNILTLIRILLVPVFVITYYEYPQQRYISLAVFALASITDGVDGYLARRLDQITSFGKLCDPVADKLMILSMMFCLNQTGLLAPARFKWLNAVVLYAILAKEVFMIFGGLLMLRKGFVVHSNILGKVATAMFCAAIIMIFPGNGTSPWHSQVLVQDIGRWLVVSAVVVAYAALTFYIADSVKKVRKAEKQ